MLLMGCVFPDVEKILTIAAVMSVQNPFTNRAYTDSKCEVSLLLVSVGLKNFVSLLWEVVIIIICAVIRRGLQNTSVKILKLSDNWLLIHIMWCYVIFDS